MNFDAVGSAAWFSIANFSAPQFNLKLFYFLVRTGEDLSETRKMVFTSPVLVFGRGGMALGFGEFKLQGIGFFYR